MDRYVDLVLNYINHMEPQHWIIALAAVILVGFLCLRSMGARSHY